MPLQTLKEIRTKFVDLSGRTDLVVDTTDYVDNGANFYIQAGQRWLDITQESVKGIGRLQKDLAIADYNLDFLNARTIIKVQAIDSAGAITTLTPRTFEYMRENYADDPANITQGLPTDWAPNIIGLAPQQQALTSANFTTEFTYDSHAIMFSDEAAHYGYQGITFRPPADEVYTLTVFGHFFSVLASDTDESYWSVKWPEILIMAANLSVEVFHRNTQGVNDWLGAIDRWLLGIDKDLADMESANINQVER